MLSTVFFTLAALGGVLLVAIIVWGLIASFKADVGLTLLSFLCSLIGIFLLVRHWQALKRPWAAQWLGCICVLVPLVPAFYWYQVEIAETFETDASQAPPP